MKPCTLPRRGKINGKNATNKGRQHMGLKPLTKQHPLSRIPSLHKKDAGFKFKNGDGGKIKALNLNTQSPFLHIPID